MRLNRFVATASGISRRAADRAISDGHVRVNGELCELGQQVGPDDVVTLDDKPLQISGYRYIAFYKPVGYVTSRLQQGTAHTIYALLPSDLATLKPVGRLDKDSSGLLILTDNGIWANELTHPRYGKLKRYQVRLNRPLTADDSNAIKRGIELEDGPSKLALDGNDRDWTIEMSEGRNRQIRRTFEKLGYRVEKLERFSFGKLGLVGLKIGKWRDINPEDVL